MSSSKSRQDSSSMLGNNKAVADAVAGVMASLISLWVFYPVEVWKTNVQASSSSSNDEKDTCSVSDDDTGKNNSKTAKFRRQESLFDQMPASVTDMLAGWKFKTLHTASSSFCYFYLYSWIITAYQKRGKTTKLSTSMRLLLTAIAAMMNTCLTLPLDVISAQHQTAATQAKETSNQDPVNGIHENNKLEEIPKRPSFGENSITSSSSDLFQQADEAVFHTANTELAMRNGSVEDNSGDIREKHSKLSEDDEVLSLATFSSDLKKILKTCPNAAPNVKRKQSLQNLASYWKGLIPSLILCSNPAIHYTVFESLKSRLLTFSASRELNMTEAFLLGLMAKFVATMATYPLIKAKVLLMVTGSGKNSGLITTNEKRDQRENNGESIDGKEKNLKKYSSLFQVLLYEYRKGGVASGLYRGCSLQLLHTLLKSALLMMFRERITQSVYRTLLQQSPTISFNPKSKALRR